MGIYTDAIANSKSFDNALPRNGVGLHINRELAGLAAMVDTALASAYAAANSVQVIATDAVDHTGGDFTLTFYMNNANGNQYKITTGTIAYNASAATVTTAINSAFTTAAYPGWVNGHIVVTASSTDLQGGTLTLTFSGAAVSGRGHALVVMDDNRTGGTSPDPTIAATSLGNSTREAMAVLIATGTVVGAVPTAGSNPTWTAGNRALGRILELSTIRSLARDAAIADNNPGIYTAVAALYSI